MSSPERASEHGPEHVSDRAPERAGERVSERAPERVSERAPDRVSERAPDRVSSGADERPGRSRPRAAATTSGAHGQHAAHSVVRQNTIEFHAPFVGRVTFPPPDHLAWYGAIGVLAVCEVIEWPVAALLALGKALSDSHRNKAIEEFGRALDEVA